MAPKRAHRSRSPLSGIRARFPIVALEPGGSAQERILSRALLEEALERFDDGFEFSERPPHRSRNKQDAEVLGPAHGSLPKKAGEARVVLRHDRAALHARMREELAVRQATELFVLGYGCDVISSTAKFGRNTPRKMLIEQQSQARADCSRRQRASSRSAKRRSRSISASISCRKSA